MTSLIELKIDTEDSDFNSLRICVNDQLVEYSVTSDTISICCDIDMGIHQLTVQLLDGKRLNIVDAVINSSGLRQAFWLSYIKTISGIAQPATVLWESTQQWVLPFGNPVSYWLTLVTNKIQSRDLSKNLYEIYNIIYPDKIIVDHTYPKIVRDFFEHNFDFFCESKDKITLLPQRKSNIKLPETDVQQVLDEINSNYNLLVDLQKSYDQKMYNDREWVSTSQPWLTVPVFRNGKFTINDDQLPALRSLIQALPVHDLESAFIGILPPGTYIAPHVDKTPGHYPGKEGCNRLYIPLLWPKGNYFKFASGGMIDSCTPWFINNTDHVHSLINSSNEYRVILTLTLNSEKNQHLLA